MSVSRQSGAPAAESLTEKAYRLIEELMHFLTTHRGGPIEEEVFVTVPERGYGTRSSTVVVMTDDEITIREMSHPSGEVVNVNLRTSASSADESFNAGSAALP